MTGAEVRQAVLGGRRRIERLVVADEEILTVLEGLELLRRASRISGELVLSGLAAAGESRVGDRTVAGASAEVAGEPVVHYGAVGIPVRVVEREQGHDEAGRAEPALGSVVVNERLLHGMEIRGARRQVVNGDHFGSVQGAKELNATVRRLVDHAPFAEAPDSNGAGAAVPFGAAFLGARGSLAETQMLEERLGGGEAIEARDQATTENAQGTAHRRTISQETVCRHMIVVN